MASTAPYYHNTRSSNNANSTSGHDSDTSGLGVQHYDAQTSAAMAMSAAADSSYLGSTYNGRGDHEDDSNNQLASLLQAANSAAGADPKMNHGSATTTGRSKRKRASSPAPSVGQPEDPEDLDDAAQMQLQQDADDWQQQPATRSSKRMKGNHEGQDEALDETHLPQHVLNRPLPDLVTAPYTDPRSLGVHSAAALFRRPSDANTTGVDGESIPSTPQGPTKKQTRPPMSKLYSSLRLSAENFLRLQSAAKAYMLDTNHPERQNCVGNRGRGDIDMTKLRLFTCVRDFLDLEGAGERFFGENVLNNETGSAFASGVDDAVGLGFANPDDSSHQNGVDGSQRSAPGERWIWPRDANKIVSLVTPLLRRMVTNERQRMYAIETRKGGKKEGDQATSADTLPTPETPATSKSPLLTDHNNTWSNDKRTDFPDQIQANHQIPPIDPALQSQIETAPMETASPSQLLSHQSTTTMGDLGNAIRVYIVWASRPTSQCLAPFETMVSTEQSASNLSFLIDMLRDPITRIGQAPTFDDTPGHINGENSDGSDSESKDRLKENRVPSKGLTTEVDLEDRQDGNGSETREDGSKFRKVRIQVLTSKGLMDVARNEETWEQAKREVRDEPWMEGPLKVVVGVY